MDFPDASVAQERAETVASIQSAIMDDYAQAMLGQTVTVLVDGYDEYYEQYYGRTYADSPDIDGRVWLASDDDLSEGSFVRVRIDDVINGDLSGYVLEESL